MTHIFFNPIQTKRRTYKGPSIDAIHQILINFAKWFQMRRFLSVSANQTHNIPGDHVFIQSGQNEET